MDQMADREIQRKLLNLTAQALFGKNNELNIETLNEKDLSIVLKEANIQAVFPLVYSVLKEHEAMPTNFKTTFLRTVANNIRVEHDHAELHDLLSVNNIPYVVMKGSVSAMYYPEPLLRTMGDVDFLVYKSDLERAGILLEQAGFVPEENNDHECHIAYHRKINGIRSTWEMHWEPNGIPKGEVGELAKEYLSDIIETAIPCTISDRKCLVPSPFHHGLIMLLHTATHLINTGIGLRHLGDWTVFADNFSDEEFKDMFEEKLKAIGMWRFAQILTQLSVRYLGMSQKDWCGLSDGEYLDVLMRDIFKGGNFGIKDTNRINQAKLITNAHKASVDETSLLKQFIRTMNEKAEIAMPVTKKVPVLFPVGWIYAGGRHLLRIRSGKRPRINVSDMVRGANERRELYKEFRLFQVESEIQKDKIQYASCDECLNCAHIDANISNFLRILKYVITGTVSTDLPKLNTPVDWKALEALSKAHNLFPLFHEGACHFPEYRNRPEYEDNINLVMTMIGQQIKKTESFLELYRAFLKEDLHPIVMKGLICRQLYGKHAEKRPSGDEDILVRKEDFYKVKEVMEKQGFVCSQPDVTPAQLEQLQDVGFYESEIGFLIEVHTNIMGHTNQMRTKMGDCFKDVFERTRTAMIHDVPVTTMSHTDHFLFLVLHAFKHFSLSGVGVRQMLDILLYQKAFEQEIDWAHVKAALDDNHAIGYLGDLQFIGEQYLGFEFGVRFEICSPEGLLKDMMEVGVFGKRDDADILAARINLNATKQGKVGVAAWIRMGFPPVRYMINEAPYLEEKPWLLPVEWVKRWGRFFKRAKRHGGNVMLDSVKKSRERMELLKKYGL